MTEIAFPHQENGSFYAVKFSFWSCLFFLLCLGEETDKLCRPVAGGGAGGGSTPPPRNFHTLIKFCYKSGIFLLKWTAVNGFQSIVDHIKYMHCCSSVQSGIDALTLVDM